MKIERLNDRQIRCTLTREDLAKRGLRLSEFAYGTKKARALFQDMMEQANYELGFDAQDYPLMIEAVPMGPECLVLIVTMVDDPEELDTRFSSFGPMLDEEDEDFDEEEEPYGDEPEDNTFMKMLRGMQEENDFSALADQHKARLNPVNARNIPGRTPAPQPRSIEDKGRDKDKEKARNRKEPIVRVFFFDTIHRIEQAAKHLDRSKTGPIESTLYRDNGDRRFYLTLKQEPGKNGKPTVRFVSVCALLAEYSATAATPAFSEEYLKEHCEVLIRGNALERLSAI